MASFGAVANDGYLDFTFGLDLLLEGLARRLASRSS
jgi:hypothetical protein